ncbi:hypothetical protein [Vibrio sp. HN007]|uniref:hypothetical protein n=1 Tax=Vibrio iocasae TaxID=3098914 RepID=UPI0035D4E873
MTEKEHLRETLLEMLHQQRQTALVAADNAHDAATHEQSVAETQYDTIGLEAAYLAHGQSQRVAEYDMTINRIKSLTLREFDIDDEIEHGALVKLSDGNTYWFLPVCGGMKLKSGKEQVLVVTPHSPLGLMLDGAEVEEKLEDSRIIVSIR